MGLLLNALYLATLTSSAYAILLEPTCPADCEGKGIPCGCDGVPSCNTYCGGHECLCKPHVGAVGVKELARLGGSPNTGKCVLKNCMTSAKDCMFDNGCRTTLFCLLRCGVNNQTCTYNCELDHADKRFDTMFSCMLAHECLEHNYVPSNCTNATNLETGFNTMEEMATTDTQSWWVTRGNSAAYDKFPCQHLYFNQTAAGGWRYTAFFEYERGKVASVTANISTQVSGVFELRYIEHGLRHNEHWRLVAATTRASHGLDSRVFKYCGTTQIMDYGGAIMITPSPQIPALPAAAEAYLQQRLAANGMHFSDLEVTDNQNCVDNRPYK